MDHTPSYAQGKTGASSNAGKGDAAPNKANIFKFLITTDNHLGFMERDSRRRMDSFVTFEECLRAARKEHDVDAMLLGGDLFHDNKPSLTTLRNTMTLLKRYVLGSKPISFRVLSDPAACFPNHPQPLANFQDPNLNVALPIFAIHGNHDDPGGGGVSVMEILASCGLLNYFGYAENNDDIVVRPILLQKGTTRIALYGLGNIRDERLNRCFRLRKVTFVKPKEDGYANNWFSILLIHQNRGVRTSAGTDGIKESMLRPYGFDLVIWGNEHEQLMVPQPSDGFDVIQPGSTIMTSLSAAESNPKQYGVLEVCGVSYRIIGYDLTSTRPVVQRTVVLAKELPHQRTTDQVEAYLHSVAGQLLQQSEQQTLSIPESVIRHHPMLRFPLIRINVDYHDEDGLQAYPVPNPNRFGQAYLERIVNPDDMLKLLKPKRLVSIAKDGQLLDPTLAELHPLGTRLNLSTADIGDKVRSELTSSARDQCQILSEAELAEAVTKFVNKEERDAINYAIVSLLSKAQRYAYRQIIEAEARQVADPNTAETNLLSHANIDTIKVFVMQHKKEVNQCFMNKNGGSKGHGGREEGGRRGNTESIRDILSKPVNHDHYLDNTHGGPPDKDIVMLDEAEVQPLDDDANSEDPVLQGPSRSKKAVRRPRSAAKAPGGAASESPRRSRRVAQTTSNAPINFTSNGSLTSPAAPAKNHPAPAALNLTKADTVSINMANNNAINNNAATSASSGITNSNSGINFILNNWGKS